MGKPTFDLCYSEERVLRTPAGGTLRGWEEDVDGSSCEALAARSGAGGWGPAIFGLAEINRRYLFLNTIGE